MIAALKESLIGEKIGSRVLVVSSPDKAFGEEGNPQLGIGNADTVVFVVDLVSALPDGPSGTDRKAGDLGAVDHGGGRPADRPRLHRHPGADRASSSAPR